MFKMYFNFSDFFLQKFVLTLEIIFKLEKKNLKVFPLDRKY